MIEFLSKLEASDWIAFLAALVAIGSLGISFFSYINQRRHQKDKEILNQLVLTLERAYEAIKPHTKHGEPVRDRLAWLTSSRHLLAYRRLKKSLKTGFYKNLCAEHEEYWRHNFYLLLEYVGHQSYFFWKNSSGISGDEIEPRSAAVILRFSSWPKDKIDPVDQVSFEGEVKNGNLFSALFFSFREYIKAKHPKLYESARKNDS